MNVAYVWNGQTGQRVQAFRRDFHVYDGHFSPDSQRILVVAAGERRAAGARATLDIWEIASTVRWQAPLYRADSQDVAWSPDGKQLACTTIFDRLWGYSSAQVKVWESDPGQLRQVLSLAQRDGSNWYPCAWSRDGKTLATSGPKFAVQLWDPAAAKLSGPLLEGKHTDWVHALAWSPDSKMLVSFAREGWLWDTAGGRALRPLTGLPKLPKTGPMGVVVSLAWSPNGKVLASANRDWNDVDLWDISSGQHSKPLKGHTGRPAAVAWSPDGTMLASGGKDRTVRLWKDTGTFVTALKDDVQASVTALGWLDNHTLATFGSNNRLCIWDVAENRLVRSMELSGSGRGRFSPDGRLLASTHDLAGVRLWETATGRPCGTLFAPAEEGRVPSPKQFLAIAGDGHYRAEPAGFFERNFVYVVQTAAGQALLTPQEFAEKHHYQNQPDQIHLVGK